MTWKETLEKIQAGEETARAQALRRWDSLAKPLGSLGILEEAIVRIAALTGTAEVCLWCCVRTMEWSARGSASLMRP